MEEISLISGVIILESISKMESQDYIEIMLQDGQVIILTASNNGRLKIGRKYEV